MLPICVAVSKEHPHARWIHELKIVFGSQICQVLRGDMASNRGYSETTDLKITGIDARLPGIDSGVKYFEKGRV